MYIIRFSVYFKTGFVYFSNILDVVGTHCTSALISCFGKL